MKKVDYTIIDEQANEYKSVESIAKDFDIGNLNKFYFYDNCYSCNFDKSKINRLIYMINTGFSEINIRLILNLLYEILVTKYIVPDEASYSKIRSSLLQEYKYSYISGFFYNHNDPRITQYIIEIISNLHFTNNKKCRCCTVNVFYIIKCMYDNKFKFYPNYGKYLYSLRSVFNVYNMYKYDNNIIYNKLMYFYKQILKQRREKHIRIAKIQIRFIGMLVNVYNNVIYFPGNSKFLEAKQEFESLKTSSIE